MSTTSEMAIRRSRRAIKAPQRLTSPGQVVERPQHRSSTPMDATAWSITYLSRQDARNQSWFRHLDFIKVTAEGIKKLLLTRSCENRFPEYVPPPLAPWRDPQAIRFSMKRASRKNESLSRNTPGLGKTHTTNFCINQVRILRCLPLPLFRALA